MGLPILLSFRLSVLPTSMEPAEMMIWSDSKKEAVLEISLLRAEQVQMFDTFLLNVTVRCVLILHSHQARNRIH